MKKRTYKLVQKAGVFLGGILLTIGIVFAAVNPTGTFEAIRHTATTLTGYVNSNDHSTAEGSHAADQGKAALDSTIHNAVNNDAVRMVSNPVDQPVYGEQVTELEVSELPVVKLNNAAGEPVGTATLKQVNDGVKVTISVSGLTPGKHGFHVHENAIQNGDFKSAGAHFNPTHKHHGLKNPQGSHVGDMPNLVVGADGTGEGEFIIQHGTLEKNQPNSVLGRSLIIHVGEDDEVTDPAGNSGDRVAGGNIPESVTR
ncbi:superoxide dismutase family protein [Paenibacillus solani]|uniref:Superoxide dismutase n=1 Tax=Paenibacillus solani TaxID=1705565 RepID=A0A0M1P020_9BACL|nr:superoxide dismutase family protein [Paenibacillus solani]KOR87816.1 superoxide dismutase [Paenibacillus solani]